MANSHSYRTQIPNVVCVPGPVSGPAISQDGEFLEGRRVALDVFVEQYFAARKTVNAIKQKFGKKVKVDVLMKNIDGSHKAYYAGVDVIDNFVPQKYGPVVLLQDLQKERA